MAEISYDVAVIGGGPAGMMAAGRAAACGAQVVLLEKNASLGVKLLLTGGGRCNLTNAELDQRVLLSRFDEAAKPLFSPFSQFGVPDTLEFFQAHGVSTKVEAENRVFPVSDSAQSVLQALVEYMREGKVTVILDAEVMGFEIADKKICGVRLKERGTVRAKSFVLATGGKSRPETGSTGEGFLWLEAIGHTIIAPRPSLVPLRVAESWVTELAGASFSEAKITVLQNEKKLFPARKGKILFTHVGLSGPLVLNMSRSVSEWLPHGPVLISLDLFPQVNLGELDRQLQAILATTKNKRIRNSIVGFVPPILIPVFLRLIGVDSAKLTHSVTRDERLALVRLLKDIRVTVTGLLGADKAIITSGGVALSEVDCKYMRSRLYPNLYLAGDILNIDRPSGGYSLQLCWTTGFVAGTAAAKK